jgi:hypothetical protein
MPRTPKQQTPPKDDQRPDAWKRFERAVDAAVKGGPKHRPSTSATKPKKGEKRRTSKDK